MKVALLALTLIFAACSSPGPKLLPISADAQIVVRRSQTRPFYITRRGRAYDAAELQSYLETMFAASPQSATHAIALIPEEKMIGQDSSVLRPILTFAASRGISVAILTPEGNAMDGLIFGDNLLHFGVHEPRSR